MPAADDGIEERINRLRRERAKRPDAYNPQTGKRLTDAEIAARHRSDEYERQRAAARKRREAQERERRHAEQVQHLGKQFVHWAIANRILATWWTLRGQAWILAKRSVITGYRGGYSVSHQGIQDSSPGDPVMDHYALVIDDRSRLFEYNDGLLRIRTTVSEFGSYSLDAIKDTIAQTAVDAGRSWLPED